MSAGVFADSSALVKLYADEPGCADVRTLPHLVVNQPGGGRGADGLGAAHPLTSEYSPGEQTRRYRR